MVSEHSVKQDKRNEPKCRSINFVVQHIVSVNFVLIKTKTSLILIKTKFTHFGLFYFFFLLSLVYKLWVFFSRVIKLSICE